MTTISYFFQECPTCGRHVRVKAEYLGRRLSCLHCHGEFVAADRESRFESTSQKTPPLLARVERLLALAETVAPAAVR